MKRLLISVLAIVFFCSLSTTAQERTYTKEEIELYKKQMMKLKSAGYRDFIIEGVVVDEKGKPLDNVEMEITKKQFTFWD